jgi:hypothetical protein
MTKTLIIICLIICLIYYYYRQQQSKKTSTDNKATQTDATSFSDSLGNDYTIEKPILSRKDKRKLKKKDD